MEWICINGKITRGDKPVLMGDNRAFRYGDGLFETMKMQDGRLRLADLHFERLFSSLDLLKYELPVLLTRDTLEQQIIQLAHKNGVERLARIRLSFYRGHGGLYDEQKSPGYLIEAFPLNNAVNSINENGLVIGICPTGRKAIDELSNLKSANFLAYSMAALFAKENKWNDALVLNTNGQIADSTIANIFLVHGSSITTPAASQGCVAGVMRRYLLEKMQFAGMDIRESVVTEQHLLSADELFLTNAIQGVRWVAAYQDRFYKSELARKIDLDFVQTIGL